MAILRRTLRPCHSCGWRKSWRRRCDDCGLLLTAWVYLKLQQGLSQKLILALVEHEPVLEGVRERVGRTVLREGGG
jgi:hypothetical protein